MKIIYLIPPSEGKQGGGNNESEQLSFLFDKPSEIAVHATPRDLHCKDKRYYEAIEFNKQNIVGKSQYTQAISRYSGVMFNAIDYQGMSDDAKQYFEENFLVVSGLYGLVKPRDIIGDYKLPIGTKGLYKFWGDTITKAIESIGADVVVNLLPQSYAKAINFNTLSSQVIHVRFLKYRENSLVNMAHGVKKVKGEWIKNICEKLVIDYTQFSGDLVKQTDSTELKIIHK